ncbi:hypothetical protein FACS1894217_01400 [Clostridia bacterium]|nr:hypothetical protein FACS1894217_01400 [Clostridia bacterium]
MDNRDIEILRKIIRYCDEARETCARLGNSLEALSADFVFKNAVAMCVLQIGELVSHLSDEVKARYPDMPWRDIKAMRNIAAHKYGDFRVTHLWDTVAGDIPELKLYCLRIISDTMIKDSY